MTRILTAALIGTTPISQSKPHDEPKIDEKETHDAYDKRTWRHKAHFDATTRQVLIPPMSIKLAVAEAAKRLSLSIPGKRGAKYTKNVLSGVLVLEDVPVLAPKDGKIVPLLVDDLRDEVVFANADGVRGSGKRVFRRFPITPANWSATATIHVIDSELPEDVIERCLREAGNLIGIGRFRPEKGGYLGRFEVGKVAWQKPQQKLAA